MQKRKSKLHWLNAALQWTGFVVIRRVEEGKPDRFALVWVGLPPDAA